MGRVNTGAQMQSVKMAVYRVMEGETRLGRVVNFAIMLLIGVSFVAIIIESMADIGQRYRTEFHILEVSVIAVFTLEYALRLWSCTADPAYAHPLKGRVKFAGGFFSVIDLMAILPFYLAFLGLDLRALRLFRLLRVFKLLRHFTAAELLPQAFHNKRQELIITAAVVLVLFMISSAFIYAVEHDAQPEAFSSIPAAMWWAVATLSTVGYGDIAPVTPWGKFLGGIVAFLGIGMFALPAGILAQGLNEAIEASKAGDATTSAQAQAPTVCPHCGHALKPKDEGISA